MRIRHCTPPRLPPPPSALDPARLAPPALLEERKRPTSLWWERAEVGREALAALSSEMSHTSTSRPPEVARREEAG
eukprot:CAMPEP_0202829480 /NCGR_PEP_ID=MMETSP1389-20130828/15545_1 /ASSEMBLY_ACC=CAM_ASM_000865 /TAXON_ID=302021 /ORGANISM="Rhodomonas sp., Strain CCMP768" /LENGTH=75 /DNA_ID=CAMNT_0049503037 /DNA_START=30 /DNA_END=253 /DNA_ORIENTATION=-